MTHPIRKQLIVKGYIKPAPVDVSRKVVAVRKEHDFVSRTDRAMAILRAACERSPAHRERSTTRHSERPMGKKENT